MDRRLGLRLGAVDFAGPRRTSESGKCCSFIISLELFQKNVAPCYIVLGFHRALRPQNGRPFTRWHGADVCDRAPQPHALEARQVARHRLREHQALRMPVHTLGFDRLHPWLTRECAVSALPVPVYDAQHYNSHPFPLMHPSSLARLLL
eukprot:COSAG01_NODE_287_length_19408_cov_231.791703_16_plen_149_part_00